MTDRILLHAHADENTIQLRTVSARVKSPRRFYVTYDELDRLKRDGHIISNDIHCFLQARLDERRDLAAFDFTWLAGHCFDRVEGFEQTVRIRWAPFREFLENSRTAPGTSRPSPWTCPGTVPGSCSTATGPTCAPPSATR